MGDQEDFFRLPSSAEDGATKKASTVTKVLEEKEKKKAPKVREKMKDGEMVKSEQFVWKVIKLLGSGGFSDVYRVAKFDNLDRNHYAMKTETVSNSRRISSEA